MHNHIAQIDQDPFARIFAFGAQHRAAGLFHLVVKVFGQRPRLAVGRAAHNHHPIKHAGQRLGVKDLNVLALDVLKGVDNGVLQLQQIH